MDQISNDDDGSRMSAAPARQGAHGHAALMLVESLIHGLIARKTLRVADAIEIVDVALDVGQEIDADADDGFDARQLVVLLTAVKNTLSFDLKS